MAVLKRGDAVLEANQPSRVMVIGGEPIGPRHIWWNFVHSSRERIERAKRDWTRGALKPVPGDHEITPLPGD